MKSPNSYDLYYYIQCLISDITGFKAEDIILIYVKKTRMRQFNEFNYFEFIYRKKKYTLDENILKEDS